MTDQSPLSNPDWLSDKSSSGNRETSQETQVNASSSATPIDQTGVVDRTTPTLIPASALASSTALAPAATAPTPASTPAPTQAPRPYHSSSIRGRPPNATLHSSSSRPVLTSSPSSSLRIPTLSGLGGSNPQGPGGASSSAIPPPLFSSGSHSSTRKAGPSRRFVYSTDDDEAEIEADLEREYYEGYSDGLKERLRRPKSIGANMESPRLPNHSLTPQKSRSSSTKDSSQNPATSGDNADLHHHHHHTHHNHSRQSSLSRDNLRETRSGEPAHESISEILNETDEDFNGPENERDAEVGEIIAAEIEELDEEDPADHDSNEFHNLHHEIHKDRSSDESDNDNDDFDASSTTSNETFTLRERQDAINITHPFGIRIWKPAVYKKNRSVQRFAEGDIHSTPGKTVSYVVWIGNVLWTLIFGILLMLVCTLASATCFLLAWSPSCKEYGNTLFSLGTYLLFPFGKFVQLSQDENYLEEDEGVGRSIADYERWQAADQGRLFFGPVSSSAGAPGGPLDSSIEQLPPASTENEGNGVSGPDPDPEADAGLNSPFSGSESGLNRKKRRLFGRGQWNLGRIIFYLWFYLVIFPLLFVISMICWFGVFSLPMAKVTNILSVHLRRHPLALSFQHDSSYPQMDNELPDSTILLCTYRALGSRYYKYTIDGTNIFFINLMAVVFFVIFDYYVLYEQLHITSPITNPGAIFCISLASVVPLAYFIGQAVASISAQSSMGMGATINAFFSTIVEVFLYCVALDQGKGDLVEGSIVGSIFAGVLLMPGFSMCFGAIRRKTQRYNPKSAGVSSTMLLFAIIAAFAPTIFYQIYGTYELRCRKCLSEAGIEIASTDCQRCHFYQVPLVDDTIYREVIKPFSYICAVLLFISYVIGLWFTLRTHAAMIWQTPTSSELTATTTAGPPIAPPPTGVPGTISVTQTPTLSKTNSVAVPIVNTVSGNYLTISPKSAGISPTDKSSAAPPILHNADGTQKPVNRNATLVTNDSVKHVTLQPHHHHGSREERSAPVEAIVGIATSTGGHDAPNWSRTKSAVILLGATVLYAIIAEILVDTVDVVLSNFAISQKLLGITIFALVPNVTEFLNAISFAINGNIALSMEIGSAYVLQVCLLQIPALIFYSIISEPKLEVHQKLKDYLFILVFPRWDLFMVIFCVFLFSYIYAEGKSNYFKGSILLLAYLVVMVGFYFSGLTAEAGIMDFVPSIPAPASSPLQFVHQDL